MVVPREPTLNDSRLYFSSLRKIFDDKTYKEFIKVLEDIRKAPRDASIFARFGELLKDHPKLLLGFISFLTEDMLLPLVPPDPKGPFETIQTMVGKRVSPSPVLTMHGAMEYMVRVEEAFHDEPAKYDEFLDILRTAHTVDEAESALAKVEELMIEHRDLFLDFSVISSAQPKITIPKQQTTPRPKKKRKRAKRY